MKRIMISGKTEAVSEHGGGFAVPGNVSLPPFLKFPSSGGVPEGRGG